MNQMCKVCGEPAAGFHFGAFTCEGCKSFFGRTYNNLSSISECKNNGECVINKKNRTACKACRLRKCLYVGMSKSGSRYGRRSNWFKIHCLLQEQQQQHQQQQQSPSLPHSFQSTNHSLSNPLNFLLPNQQQQQQQHQHQQSYQNNNKSPSPLKSNHPPNPCLLTNPFLSVGRQLLNGNSVCMDKTSTISHRASSNSSSDSGASSADPEDSIASNKDTCRSPVIDQRFNHRMPAKCLDPVRSISEPLNPYMAQQFATASPTLPLSPQLSMTTPTSVAPQFQDEPIDLSIKSQERCQTVSPKPNTIENVPKMTPLDLTLVRSNALSG